MHCDIKGQQKIAKILEDEIRDMIYVLPRNYETTALYPPPESLKRKFLIKSKADVPVGLYDIKNKDLFPHLPEELSIFDDEMIPEIDVGRRITCSKTHMMPAASNKNSVVENQESARFIFSSINLFKKDAPLTGVLEDIKVKAASENKKHKKVKSYPGLAKYYTLCGVKMNLKKERSIWTTSSLSEDKITTLIKNNAQEITDFCNKYFVRVYPLGTRFDSSNYDPTNAWTVGAQMVALNFQTSDENMLLNYAKFAANGGCGYVLKPEYLTSTAIRDPTKAKYVHDFTEPRLKLTIRIISGQQFQFEKQGVSDLVDPWVEVKLKGSVHDEKQNKVFRTQTVKNNGFNPIWSTPENPNVMEFMISAPDLATLVVKVSDSDRTKSSKLAWYAIDVPHIVGGYRVIPMLNSRFDEIPHCFVYAHIKLEYF